MFSMPPKPRVNRKLSEAGTKNVKAEEKDAAKAMPPPPPPPTGILIPEMDVLSTCLKVLH